MDYSVIKEGDLFLLTEKNGDIDEQDEKGYGLYSKDTRFLNKMEMYLDDRKPMKLSSNAKKSYFAEFFLMNEEKDEGAVEINRSRFIYEGVLYERVAITNHFLHSHTCQFSASFDADFQDMFLVRKYREGEVGTKLETIHGNRKFTIRYQGKDDQLRQTTVGWDHEDAEVENTSVHLSLQLAPKQREIITFSIAPHINDEKVTFSTFDKAFGELEKSYQSWYNSITKLSSDSDIFNGLYHRGIQDLRMLMTDVGNGTMPVAGLPWYAVPFGRDSLITSLFMLPLNPEKVKGTLRTLAAYQGEKDDKWRDEQPGKIMHEIRFGELANTNQSPFTPYYGSVDATPLFLVVIGEYFHWSGDLDFIKELKPNILRALEWIDSHQEFLTYHQEAEDGFPNQGWKDSSNSIVHKNGRLASSPIALSEVQGYVYQAKSILVPIFELLGEPEVSSRLRDESSVLRDRFEDFFWMEEDDYYAIALDNNKEKVQSVTSNPGHLLLSGLPTKVRAERVAKRLTAPDMFNGYGIRTMSTDATGYYPVSYHNGSVWPHDNAIILLGLSRYQFDKETNLVISGLLDASTYFDYQRLPELFCGHEAEIGYPIPYPSTCSPQAWSAGIAVSFVQAMLGINPNAINKQVTLHPSLPDHLNWLEVDRLQIGNGYLSLVITRLKSDEHNFDVNIKENTTGFDVSVN